MKKGMLKRRDRIIHSQLSMTDKYIELVKLRREFMKTEPNYDKEELRTFIPKEVYFDKDIRSKD